MLLPCWLAAHALFGAALQTSLPDPEPLLVPAGLMLHDFGLAFEGDRLEHDFVFKVGEEPIMIDEASPT